MATIYGSILGVSLLREPVSGGIRNLALVSFTMPAYSASSDSGSLGAGGYLYGISNSATLAAIIQNVRRDGKTVTLRQGCTAESGKHGSTEFYAATFAESSGSLTFNVANAAGTEIDAASGVSDRPITVCVAYDLS